MLTVVKYVYIYSVFYFPVIAFVEVAILIFYRRIFFPSSFRFIATVMIAICAAWLITALVIEIGYPSHPIGDYFAGGPMTKLNVNYLTFWLTMAIIEIILELVILLLPMREVYHLQLSAKKKYLCSMMFALGGFVIITGIIRIAKVYKPGSADVDLTQGDIWLNVHLGTAIICACLPTYRPLFSRNPWLSKKVHSFHPSGGNSGDTGGSHKLPTVPKNVHHSDSADMMHKIFAGHEQSTKVTYADARHSEDSSTAENPWQEERAVGEGATICVKQTVDIV